MACCPVQELNLKDIKQKVLLLLKSYTSLYLLIDLCDPSHFPEYMCLKLCKLLIHIMLISFTRKPSQC